MWLEYKLNEFVNTQLPLQQDDGASKSSVVYAKQNYDFWQHLGLLANSDAAGLSELLGISEPQVRTWYDKIQKVAQQANRMKSEKQKTVMVPTGNK